MLLCWHHYVTVSDLQICSQARQKIKKLWFRDLRFKKIVQMVKSHRSGCWSDESLTGKKLKRPHCLEMRGLTYKYRAFVRACVYILHYVHDTCTRQHVEILVCAGDNAKTEKLKRKVVKGAETGEVVRKELKWRPTTKRPPEAPPVSRCAVCWSVWCDRFTFYSVGSPQTCLSVFPVLKHLLLSTTQIYLVHCHTLNLE